MALAYAEKYSRNVSQIVLFGVTTGRHSEFDWTFRGGLSRFFPEEWNHLLSAIPGEMRGLGIVEAFCTNKHYIVFTRFHETASNTGP